MKISFTRSLGYIGLGLLLSEASLSSNDANENADRLAARMAQFQQKMQNLKDKEAANKNEIQAVKKDLAQIRKDTETEKAKLNKK